VIISLEGKETRSNAETEMLKLNQTLIVVADKNQRTADFAVGTVLAIGVILSAFGAVRPPVPI
jgi:hypothetical protein